MKKNSIASLKIKFQEIIDLIAQKKVSEAELKMTVVTEIIDDLIDYSISDEELQALSPFQILVNHLQLKIDILKTSLN
ncbi:hypothetical protein OX283_010365 [Flavobacterium sp. SUN052]|uniref:hypothetical protein n=1 Tax=Flavobacterium sp. SUN052 TaxID=3002441 RepID=UPI00237EC00C|nr:hypothetical protein [Flavobacterium sp. SUN052]MEC4005062.1 hypothetical protein [Flavobacterium sp. SUN052]